MDGDESDGTTSGSEDSGDEVAVSNLCAYGISRFYVEFIYIILQYLGSINYGY